VVGLADKERRFTEEEIEQRAIKKWGELKRGLQDKV